jgi:hypothetical protein
LTAGAQAFGEVLTNARGVEIDTPQPMRPGPGEASSADLLRRMSRVLLGYAAWTRSPAPQ